MINNNDGNDGEADSSGTRRTSFTAHSDKRQVRPTRTMSRGSLQKPTQTMHTPSGASSRL
jgi:hypothetical protein